LFVPKIAPENTKSLPDIDKPDKYELEARNKVLTSLRVNHKLLK